MNLFDTEIIEKYLFDITKDFTKTSAKCALEFVKYLASIGWPYILDIYEAIWNYVNGKIENVTINSVICEAKRLLHGAYKLGCSAFKKSKFLYYSGLNGLKSMRQDFAFLRQIYYEKVNKTKATSPVFYGNYFNQLIECPATSTMEQFSVSGCFRGILVNIYNFYN